MDYATAVVENEGITKSLQETEDWLYEDSDEQKLKDLKKVCRECYYFLFITFLVYTHLIKFA